jgi:lipid II:glycine glycyltransferase (peptidoglycan interpeptide bridge formation enzyme)
MNIREIKTDEKVQWNEFVNHGVGSSFLQTFEWGEFMSTQKEKIYRLIVEEDNEWLAVIFLYKSRLKMNQSILYAPHGPVFSSKSKVQSLKSKVFELLMERIEEIAGEERSLMFQVDPLSASKEWFEIFDKLGFVKSEIDVQPKHTLILDLRKSPEDLLKAMHPKTRYNIHLAEKKDIKIEVDNRKSDEFYKLLTKTMERQQISMFTEEYFKKIMELPFVHLYLAKVDWQYIAANIMIFCGDTATYLFGATDYEARGLRAPFLLQWKAMQDATAANFKFYDFWGAAPPNATGREEGWSGFTQFKMGFAPKAEITEYVGTYEKQFQPVKLGVYRFLQKFYRR